MRVSFASESGRLDGRNEDWAGATSRVAVVLDGLTEAAETGCVHGTPWFVAQLGWRLSGAGESVPLDEVLRVAIRDVALLHRDTCELGHPGSPGCTVAMVRERGDEVDYLVLSDATVVLDVGDEPLVVCDKSVENFFRDKAAVAGQARGGQPLYDLIQAQQKIRNQPGGYWIAQTDPSAASHARVGTVSGVRGALLMSDGAALLAAEFGVLTWAELVEVGYSQGPSALIALTREWEDRDPEGVRWPRYKRRDDATAVVCRF
ncbi:hypothetical protein [Longispora urticae]